MMIGENGIFPSRMPNMGMNPMMMMGGPVNPYGMYGSLNPLFAPNAMGVVNPYSTVNPSLYYQSKNANVMGGIAPPMNLGGFGGSASGVGSPNVSARDFGMASDGFANSGNRAIAGVSGGNDEGAVSNNLTMPTPNTNSTNPNLNSVGHPFRNASMMSSNHQYATLDNLSSSKMMTLMQS